MGPLFIFLLFGAYCVSASDTDLKCTKPHEVPDCLFTCPPQRTCSNYKYALPCVPPTGACKPQCVCDEGYARNLDGICITLAQCEQCSNNQHFTCNGPYDEHCQGTCVCNDGYKLDANNTCVSINPSPPIVIAQPPPHPPGNPPVSTGPVSPPTSSGPEPLCSGNAGDQTTGVIAEPADAPTAEQINATGETAATNPTDPTSPTEQTKPTCETLPTV